MADLDVQRKKKNPVIWVIVTIVVLAILLLLYKKLDGSGKQAANTRDTVTARGMSSFSMKA